LNLFDFIVCFLAAVRIGSIDGQFIANPSRQQMQKSDLNLVVSVNPKGHLGKIKTFHSIKILCRFFSDDRCISKSFIG
jgi:polyribonucleotide nucleotidyltransferase